MFKTRPVPPLNQWIKVPRASWHFPQFEPPKIGPRLPLPARPRLFAFHLKKHAYKGLTPRLAVNQRFSNPLITRLKNQSTVLDRVMLKQQRKTAGYVLFSSSRVRPYRLRPPKSTDEFWKHGFKAPMPSHYAIGCRRPVKNFDLPTGEFHFRLMHPQFRTFLDKWNQPGLNLDDQRNVQLIEAELNAIFATQRNQRSPLFKNKVSSLKRPFAYASYIERFVMTAHLDETGFLRRNRNNFEALKDHEDRLSKQVIQIWHDLDEYGFKKGSKESLEMAAAVAAKKK